MEGCNVLGRDVDVLLEGHVNRSGGLDDFLDDLEARNV